MRPRPRKQPGPHRSLLYGSVTGQTVAPLVVHVTRPWRAGLSGDFAVM